eukprot:scaffold118697_cov21-Tisochrysis_lutea.AAC.4
MQRTNRVLQAGLCLHVKHQQSAAGWALPAMYAFFFQPFRVGPTSEEFGRVTLSSWLQFCSDAHIMDSTQKGCTRADLAVSCHRSSFLPKERGNPRSIREGVQMMGTVSKRWRTVFVAVKGGTDTKSNEAISDDAMMRWVASHEQHLQNTFFLGELVYNERYRAGHPHAAPLAPFALLAHIFDA